MFLKGNGVAQDWNKAFQLYQQCLDKNTRDAFRNLGFCYENGYGVTQDINKAIEYYKRAIEEGDRGAMKHLGICYMNGNGVEKDEKRGIELLKQASEKGSKQAKAILSKLLENPINEVSAVSTSNSELSLVSSSNAPVSVDSSVSCHGHKANEFCNKITSILLCLLSFCVFDAMLLIGLVIYASHSSS